MDGALPEQKCIVEHLRQEKQVSDLALNNQDTTSKGVTNLKALLHIVKTQNCSAYVIKQ